MGFSDIEREGEREAEHLLKEIVTERFSKSGDKYGQPSAYRWRGPK